MAQFDKVWGIDRYEGSPTFGLQVVPVILLWVQPGASPEKKNLTGALAHGAQVEIISEERLDDLDWFHVRSTVDGKTQEGFVRGTLLRDRGILEPGIIDPDQNIV